MRIELECDGDRCMMCCEDGRKRRVDCVPMDARYIGLKLKVFELANSLISWQQDGLILYGSLSRAVDQIHDVLNSSEKHIAKARGQIEDAGGITDGLSDLDIAIMDVYVREWLAEQAREVDDPFNAHERGPYAVNQTIRIDAPYLPELFAGYVGENSKQPVAFD